MHKNCQIERFAREIQPTIFSFGVIDNVEKKSWKSTWPFFHTNVNSEAMPGCRNDWSILKIEHLISNGSSIAIKHYCEEGLRSHPNDPQLLYRPWFGIRFLCNSDVGDIVMLVTLWWRLIWDVGRRIIMLATFFVMFSNLFNRSPTSWIGHQHLKLVANTFDLQNPSPTSL